MKSSVLLLTLVQACTPALAPERPAPPVEPPLPTPTAAPDDGTDAIAAALAERLSLRDGLLDRLARTPRIWQRADSCVEHIVELAPASRYASELAIATPSPNDLVLVLYRGPYPEVVLLTEPAAIKLAEVAADNPHHDPSDDDVALGCCGSSIHVVTALSETRADLQGLDGGKSWSLYFSREACAAAPP